MASAQLYASMDPFQIADPVSANARILRKTVFGSGFMATMTNLTGVCSATSCGPSDTTEYRVVSRRSLPRIRTTSVLSTPITRPRLHQNALPFASPVTIDV
jgi:hypothetical protein